MSVIDVLQKYKEGFLKLCSRIGCLLHMCSRNSNKKRYRQAGLDEEDKKWFWEDLDEMVSGILLAEKLFIRGDVNRTSGQLRGGMMMRMEVLCLGTRTR